MNVRTIVLVLGIFVLLSTATGGYLQYRSAQESASKQVEWELWDASDVVKDNVHDLMAQNLSKVRILARFVQIQEALLNQSQESLLPANQILDHFAENLFYDVGYLMDISGKTIASSNRNQPDSFLGQNYSFRPYFIDAIQGRPGTYFAVGATSGVRGIYFSHPVYREGDSKPIGVAVIKVSIQDLVAELSRRRTGIELLVHSSGMILASSREDWTLNLLWRVLPEELSQIENTQQFGKGPWNWTGLEKKGDNQAVDASGEEYLIYEMSLENCPGWRIVSLYSENELSGRIVNPLVGKTGYVALFVCFLVGGVVIFLYVLAQHDITDRKRAEEALRQSEAKYRAMFENMNSGAAVYRPVDDGAHFVFTDFNRAAERISKVRREDLMGKSLLEMFPQMEKFGLFAAFQRVYQTGQPEHLPASYYKDQVREGWRENFVYRLPDGQIVAMYDDVTDRKQAEDSLRKSETQLREIIDLVPHMIFVKDWDGRYLLVNQAVAKARNMTVSELTGKSHAEVHAEENEAHYRLQDDREVMTTGKPKFIREEEYTDAFGKKHFLQTTKVPFHTLDEKTRAVLGVAIDITERKNAEEALKEARDELEDRVEQRTSELLKANEMLEVEIAERIKAEQMLRESHQRLEHSLTVTSQLRTRAEAASAAKTEFLTTMSHELRTPLTAIIGFSELLEGQWAGVLNDKQVEYVGEVLGAGRHLLQLINDILDLAKVESGKMDVQISRLHVGQLLHGCLTMVKERAIKRRQVLDLRIPEDLAGAEIFADEVKLKQIIVNLLSNAAKFTPGGGRITLEADQEGDELLITIFDTGIGIRPEDQSRIFEAFEQVDSTFSRQEQGTGLGLALVRRLVELHGGRIWVESEGEDKGSIFRFTIPFIQAGTMKEAESQPLDATGALSVRMRWELTEDVEVRPAVLVVEDNPASMNLSVNLLEAGGYKALKAYSAEEGIRIAENESPALILMDISLPGMDGLTATRVLKQGVSTSHIPVVALTAHAMKDDESKVREAGCEAYLVKPVDTRTFYKTLAGFVKAAKEEAVAE